MTIKISFWIIPLILTAVCCGLMIRPYQRTGEFDFGAIFRLFWLIPVAFIWAIYFAILYFTKHQ